MPAASFNGAICSGHGCFPPRPGVATAMRTFAGDIPVLRVGDAYPVHSCGDQSHPGTVSAGSLKSFVAGIALARIGDAISCGSVVAQGSEKSFSGG